jgi:chitinase
LSWGSATKRKKKVTAAFSDHQYEVGADFTVEMIPEFPTVDDAVNKKVVAT